MRTVCCVCKKTKCGDFWIWSWPRKNQKVSHGYCPKCFDKLLAAIDLRAAGSRAA